MTLPPATLPQPILMLAFLLVRDCWSRLDPSRSTMPRSITTVATLGCARASTDFNAVIKLVAKVSEGYNNRAMVLMDQGKLDAAISDYNTAIRLQPDNWRGYSSRGEAYRLKGDRGRALTDHDEAIRLDQTQ